MAQGAAECCGTGLCARGGGSSGGRTIGLARRCGGRTWEEVQMLGTALVYLLGSTLSCFCSAFQCSWALQTVQRQELDGWMGEIEYNSDRDHREASRPGVWRLPMFADRVESIWMHASASCTLHVWTTCNTNE